MSTPWRAEVPDRRGLELVRPCDLERVAGGAGVVSERRGDGAVILEHRLSGGCAGGQ